MKFVKKPQIETQHMITLETHRTDISTVKCKQNVIMDKVKQKTEKCFWGRPSLSCLSWERELSLMYRARKQNTSIYSPGELPERTWHTKQVTC